MKIIGYFNDTGSSYWRGKDPFKYLRTQGYEAYVSDEGITDKALAWADVVVMNSITDKEGIMLISDFQQAYDLKVVVDCDDYFDLNPDSPFIKEHEVAEAKEVIKATMEFADMVTCTTTFLEHKLKEINKNVVVLPNMMDLDRWDLPKHRNESDKLRIGWAGSITHLDDLKYIVEPLTRIKEEFPDVQLIFVGEPRIADEFSFPVEIVPGVDFDSWPARLNGLRLDIGLAPLLDTPFNRAKSNIKFQEYAIAQIPAIYSPIVYQHTDFEPKFGIVAEDKDHWYRAIKHLIAYPSRREEIRDNAYTLVKRKYDLERHISIWTTAYKSLLNRIDTNSQSV